MANNRIKTVCAKDQCAGCMACLSRCHKNAIDVVDSLSAYNAVIDPDLCVDCGQCNMICPNNHPEDKGRPVVWYQGWASDDKIRMEASSGGIATALSAAFVKNGGEVCSCTLIKGEFTFSFAASADEVKKFTGSKYVKSNPNAIYPAIKNSLKSGKKVLFIGLPCQVAAVKKYVGYNENLFTVDLICHGTPSPKLLEMFLLERGYELNKVTDLKFRKKTNFHLASDYTSIEPATVRDRYTFSFLRSLDYTENCYSCQYARIERVSDLTIGDSWGSDLPQEEQLRGVSLILCQNQKGKELLQMAELHLETVDLEKAIKNNRQLMQPSDKPEKWDVFFKTLKTRQKFNSSVARCYPMICLRQKAKALFIKIKPTSRGDMAVIDYCLLLKD